MGQWEKEVADRSNGALRVCWHYGAKRTKNPKDFHKYDIGVIRSLLFSELYPLNSVNLASLIFLYLSGAVLTTFRILTQEYSTEASPCHKLHWHRVVIVWLFIIDGVVWYFEEGDVVL